MKRLALFLIMAMLLPMAMMAQRDARSRDTNDSGRPSRLGFEQYLDQKCASVVLELGLNSQDSARFVPIYRELQHEKGRLWHKYGGSRRVRRAIDNGEQVADTTLMRVVNNQARLQAEDAQLELRYIERFAQVLTPMQIYKLQQAEQKFKTETMLRHRNGENGPYHGGKAIRK